jgi:PAS domain S-box-containing protein
MRVPRALRLAVENRAVMPVRLDDAAAHLAAIIASTEDAILSTNLDGMITSWNDAAERLFGWSASDVTGKSTDMLVPDERRDEERLAVDRVRNGVGIAHFDTVRQRRNGSLVDVSLTIAPILGANNSVIGVSRIARDITEQRRNEREALRLAAIVQSSDDAIVSKNLDGYILTWNKGAERLFGYTPEEAVGRHITMIIPEDRRDEETEVLRRIRAGQSVEHFETVRQRKDGSFVDISLTVSPIRRGDEIIGASKIARDISEQHRLRQEALEANRLKDEFLATLSHELRTPLNTVVGYATMLQRGSLDESQRVKAVDVIHRNAQMLTELVGELLDTSRIVTGKIRLVVIECDLSSVVTEAVENIRPSADARELTLETHVEPDVKIRGDSERLQQVMWNLLSNAVKFTPPKGRVDVTLTVSDGCAHIVVRDTGLGIRPDALPHVFQRFWQGDARSREFGGLGLGLALSRNFVELHGGTIHARSKGPGEGAEFEVDLPLGAGQGRPAPSLRRLVT